MRWPDREMAAHHEAGHAVIGRVLDLECGDVTTIPDFDEGLVDCAIISDVWAIVGSWIDKGRSYGEDAALRARIITYMAGAEAEIECCEGSSRGDEDDRRQINLMLDSFLPPDASLPSYEAQIRMIASSLAHCHRARIGLVAAALLDREALSDAEVRNIMVAELSK